MKKVVGNKTSVNNLGSVTLDSPTVKRVGLHVQESPDKFGLKNLTSLGNVSGLSSITSPRNPNPSFDKNFVIPERENETDEPLASKQQAKKFVTPKKQAPKVKKFNKRATANKKIKEKKKVRVDAFTHFKLDDENISVYKNNPELVSFL